MHLILPVLSNTTLLLYNLELSLQDDFKKATVLYESKANRKKYSQFTFRWKLPMDIQIFRSEASFLKFEMNSPSRVSAPAMEVNADASI